MAVAHRNEPHPERERYPHVLRAVAETPWAILPETLAVILELVALRARGERLSGEQIQSRLAAGRRLRDPVDAGTVAVLPLHGVLVPRAGLFSDVSGATALDGWASVFGQLVEDSHVSAIVIDVDSPGGMVDGVPETAEQIFAARGAKPIVAVANTLAASAAFWLAAQADEVIASPSAKLGSIGVYRAHEDISKLQEKAGVKTTLISSGKFKVEGNPFEPLSEEARAAIQRDTDAYYELFVADVAAGRATTVEAVRAGYGQGRLAIGADAVTVGLADRVATLDDTLDRLTSDQPGPRDARATGLLRDMRAQLTNARGDDQLLLRTMLGHLDAARQRLQEARAHRP